MIQGGCYCGAIRYELDPTDGVVVNCHCTICRKTSGAPYVTWILIAKNQFRFLGDQPTIFRSSRHGTRGFCNQCGTPISFSSTKRPEKIDITVASLDDPETYAPTEDVYVETRLGWIDGLKLVEKR